MANGSTTTALVLKVVCGQQLNATIGGVAVVIDCQGSGGPGGWQPPPPPSGAGGVVAFAEVDVDAPRLDLNAVVTAFNENRLEDAAAPLDSHESVSVVLERPDGSVGSLDAMMSERDD